MRLTNHDLNRNTSAAVAIRKALKDQTISSGSTSAEMPGDNGRMAATVEEGTAPKPHSGKCAGSTSPSNSEARRDVTAGETAQLPPCNLDYAFKDIQRRFGL